MLNADDTLRHHNVERHLAHRRGSGRYGEVGHGGRARDRPRRRDVRPSARGRLREGLEIRAIPTSIKTAKLAEELSVPLTTLDDVDTIDIDVDGADEVDPELNLIKGHGGALLRERVVASISKRFVVLVGEEKLVPHLGAKMSVPVEVVPFAVPAARRALTTLGANAVLRVNAGIPFESDNGNQIIDARFEDITNAKELETSIDEVPGVVDSGLFVGMADLVLVQLDGSSRRMERH